MSQIRLRILGESVIEVGETIVEPSATHVFALLLYLAVERGKLVTRSQLASMLFPEGSAANVGHNLRQLLYRLRRCGSPWSVSSRRQSRFLRKAAERPPGTGPQPSLFFRVTPRQRNR